MPVGFTRTIAWLFVGIVATACAAGDFGEAGAPATGDVMTGSQGDAGVSCTLGNTMAAIEQTLFKGPRCLACHQRVTLYPTRLDLVSDGLANRVVDKLADAVNPMFGKCAGRTLVPRDNPTGGLFIEKLENPTQSCGDRMPQSMLPLTADEISCAKLWATLAAQAAPRN
jgi:hypothetical protein